MNDMERVWMRLKKTATRLAKDDTLISVRDSRDRVLKICDQEKTKSPPRDAVRYLAAELVRLTLEARSPG